ncbi:MAG: RimK family protein [Gammaproteobacteria bacterium]|nr:RimK family protein [Gammaproteobacteria bacterium]
MAEHLVVLDKTDAWSAELPDLPVLSARDYLSAAAGAEKKRLRVINLCRNYEYLGLGYYCSLLAEARGQRVVPSVRTIQDLSRRSIYGAIADDLEDVVEKAFDDAEVDHETGRYEIVVCFGRTETAGLRDVARRIFELYPCPVLNVEFRKQGPWQLHAIRPGNAPALLDARRDFFASSMMQYVTRRWQRSRNRSPARYDLAILHDKDEKLPPSNPRALQKFEKAAKSRGVELEFIERRDYGRLAEFDALFIRETTRIDHHTYRFATRAESEGIVVIDDPDSILKCANKVFLAESLRARGLPTPRSSIVRRETLGEVEKEMGFPMVLKIPDGAFSTGVFKVENAAALREVAGRMFRESDLILAQEFLFTEYDWRIGVLNGRPLYACRYYMAKKHWQIMRHRDQGAPVEGDSDALAIADVPPEIIQTALRASAIIGNGLYGVDLKQTDKGVVVIEVNDNPSIDAGIEDEILGDALYEAVIDEFVSRLEQRRAGAPDPAQKPQPSKVNGAGPGG